MMSVVASILFSGRQCLHCSAFLHPVWHLFGCGLGGSKILLQTDGDMVTGNTESNILTRTEYSTCTAMLLTMYIFIES